MRRAFPLIALAASLAACSREKSAPLRSETVTKGAVAEIVSATGGVEAIISVNVGSQVSGTVSELKVDFNSLVKKGQLLARIDPRPFQVSVAKAQAGVASADATVLKAAAAHNDSVRVEKRTRDLLGRALVAQADVDTAMANREQADAALVGAKAAVKQAKADLQQAMLNLEFTRIVSPVDGIVISRSIDVGQTVASAFQAPTLFLIANDLTKMRVLANIDEADVGKVKAEQEVRFTVDSYPGEEFIGSISQVRQAPNTINNVVTYAAEVAAPNPQRKLRQGMTAAVQVITARRASVLRVPNAALRWKPDDGSSAAPANADRQSKAGPGAANAQGKTREAAADKGPRNEVLDRSTGVDGAQNPADRRAERKARITKIYKLVAGKPVAVNVRTGISDGHQTEVLDGLAEGDEVVVGGTFSAGGAGGAGQQKGGPRRGLF